MHSGYGHDVSDALWTFGTISVLWRSRAKCSLPQCIEPGVSRRNAREIDQDVCHRVVGCAWSGDDDSPVECSTV